MPMKASMDGRPASHKLNLSLLKAHMRLLPLQVYISASTPLFAIHGTATYRSS